MDTSIPISQHAEIAALGAMLIEPEYLREAVSALTADDFALDSHQKIFEACRDLDRAGKTVGLVELKDYMTSRRQLDSVGGLPYLMYLTEGMPRHVNLASYIRILKTKHAQRALLRLGEGLTAAAIEGSDEPDELLGRMRSRLDEIAEDTTVNTPMESFGNYFRRSYSKPSQIFDQPASASGVSWGFPWLDSKTGGLKAGNLYIVAARPSIGKTALAANIATSISLRGDGGMPCPVAKFTLEQDKKQLEQRMLCARARASLQDYRDGRSNREDRDHILRAAAELSDAPLYWDDTPGMTLSRMRTQILNLIRSLGDGVLKGVIVDQLSFIDRSDVRRNGRRGDEEIGEITRGLKRMARELGLFVILFCQIKRNDSKDQSSARPQLSELKNSGSIEEDADVVLMLHRPWFYSKKDSSEEGRGEFLLRKQRQGPVGSHRVWYNERSCLWEDRYMDGDEDDDQELFG